MATIHRATRDNRSCPMTTTIDAPAPAARPAPGRAAPPRPPGPARGPRRVRDAGGGGRVRASRAALQRRQGLGRPAAAGREGVSAGTLPLPGHARGHRATTSTRSSSTGTSAMADLGEELLVASVQDSIDRGRVADPGPGGSRNRLQSVTLLDAITAHGFDACIGGARRDEDKARAKERVLSFRDAFGQWDPRNQRPELWHLYHGRVRTGEHLRAFPLSDWTELDVWQYIRREDITPPVDLLRPSAPRRRARRHAAGGVGVGRPRPGRGRRGRHGPVPHRGRRHLHRGGALAGAAPSTRSSPRSPPRG